MLFTAEGFKGIGSSWSMDSFYDNHLAEVAAREAEELAQAHEKHQSSFFMALYRGVKFQKEIPEDEEFKVSRDVPISRSVIQSFKRIVSKLNRTSHP